jgi:hypothetical protein
MFTVRCVAKDRYEFSPVTDIHEALDKARSQALYGDFHLVEVWDYEVRNLYVSFNAQEMRDASERERQTRELQVVSGVHVGL